jgi:hypothetical protein
LYLELLCLPPHLASYLRWGLADFFAQTHLKPRFPRLHLPSS